MNLYCLHCAVRRQLDTADLPSWSSTGEKAGLDNPSQPRLSDGIHLNAPEVIIHKEYIISLLWIFKPNTDGWHAIKPDQYVI